MATSSQSPIRFIEDALFCTGPLALSYTDPEQKWIIRQHLISLFQNYPLLKPSIGYFTNNDGSEVKLLNANGELTSSHLTPPVPVTIWIHEFYPQVAPTVYVDLKSSIYPVYQNHPFVDPSGSTVSSYLENWQFTKCNLSDLVHNLIKLFSHNHPFYYSTSSSFTHPSLVSKIEAMDRIVCMLYYDAEAIRAKNEEEIENLTAVQGELQKRADYVDNLVLELDRERRNLKGRVNEVCDESDKVLSWLKVYDNSCVWIDEVFEPLDWKSKMVMECLANDNAVEDLMCVLDKAVEEGVVDFDVYMKKVRVLAREQFLHRAKVVEIERISICLNSRFA